MYLYPYKDVEVCVCVCVLVCPDHLELTYITLTRGESVGGEGNHPPGPTVAFLISPNI